MTQLTSVLPEPRSLLPAPRPLAVVALGGNAITPVGGRGTIEELTRILADVACQVAGLLRAGWSLVITHGNGPQVGNIKLQQEAAEPDVPGMPLDVCGAMSQGQLGYLLARALDNELRRQGIDLPVVALITRCLVDRRDPAFAHPTKPIGPFYDAATARRLERERGWNTLADAGRGLRRAVPSPVPVRIVEADQIRLLVGSGTVVIACGGGGVPVVEHDDGRLEGVEAVIDKDLAASLLAREVGAGTLALLTQVPAVSLDYGTPGERRLAEITPAELEDYARRGHFSVGSMGPKVRAVLEFLRHGGDLAVITSPDLLAEALAGRAGTRVRQPGF